MPARPPPRVLLYDGECRICAWVARWVGRLDWRGRVSVRPIQGSGAVLGGALGSALPDTMHLVGPDGRIASGGDALPGLVASLWSGPELERLLQASPAAMSSMRRLYAVLVELRGRLTCRTSSASS